MYILSTKEVGKHMKKAVPSRTFMNFSQNVAYYVYFTKSQITKENTEFQDPIYSTLVWWGV